MISMNIIMQIKQMAEKHCECIVNKLMVEYH